MFEISLCENDNGFKVFRELQQGYAVSRIYSEIWHRVTKRWVLFVYVESALIIVTCTVWKRYIVFTEKTQSQNIVQSTVYAIQWVLPLSFYQHFENGWQLFFDWNEDYCYTVNDRSDNCLITIDLSDAYVRYLWSKI